MSRALLLVALCLLTACGGGGGGKGGGAGGGGTPTPFTQSDLSGLWRGTLSPGSPAPSAAAELPFGARFTGTGGFVVLGEGYRSYPVALQNALDDSGALTLAGATSNGNDRLVLSGTMNSAKDRVSGTWQRFVGGLLDGSGSFIADRGPNLARARDFAGSWSGELVSASAATLTAASFVAGPAGSPERVLVGARQFTLPFDTFEVSGSGQTLTVIARSTALLRHYELTGTLDAQRSTFSGTWRYFDAWQGSGPLEQGDFILRRDLAAFPRGLDEIAGAWMGVATHPVLGETPIDFQFDAAGQLLAGSFGEFGSTPFALVAGTAALSAEYSGCDALLDDEFSILGVDQIAVEGVLSPVSEVWSGSLDHYFWGTCRFTVVKQ